MDNQAVIRLWKEPGSRPEDAAGHPAGDPLPPRPSTLGKRIGLLAGIAPADSFAVAGWDTIFTTTMSPPLSADS